MLGQTVHVRLCVAAGNDHDAAIENWLKGVAAAIGRQIVIAEGLLFDREGPHGVPVLGLAAGCPCCVGLPVLRVLLTKALRQYRPRALLVLLASGRHLPRVRQMLDGGELGVRFEVDEG